MKFDIFNQRKEMLTASARWNGQYRHNHDPDKAEIGRRLAALDATECSAADMEAVIGNRSWTSLFCTSCHDYHPQGVEFGEDYPARVCKSCLRGALAALESVNAP